MDGACVEDGQTGPSTASPNAWRERSACAPTFVRGAMAVPLAMLGWLTSLFGCASGRLPMIDPSGERFFVAGPVTRNSEPPRPQRHDPVGIELTPSRIIAPVGCEVVLLAGVCGPDGYMQARQSVEWMLAPGGVGQFLTVGHRGPLDWLVGFHSGPRKVDNTYAVGTTSSSYLCLTRGTPTPEDDLPVERGQAWVAVTSPVEGVSYVTAYAPGVKAWDSHTQTATIHWIDAEFAYPPPAVNPGGSRHTFTTTITRHSTRAPVAGWRVRYEITGGPPAGFAPDGAPLIEVTSNELGQAGAEIYQLDTKPGTNTVSIQVIRPADATGDRFVVGQGATQKTWTAPDISLDASGPGQGLVGDTLTYRIDVRNPGDFTAKEVTVTETLAAGVTLVSSTPPPTAPGGRLQWLLGDLQGGESRTVTLQLRADRPGTVNNCAGVTTAEKLSAQDCVATTILAPSLRVAMSGPPQAEVGQPATFQVQITNTGASALTGLLIVDRYDAGLEHASQPDTQTRVIERNLGDLAAGQTKNVDVKFTVVQAGKQCNAAEVQGSAGVLGSAKACLTGVDPGAAAAGPSNLTVTKDGPKTQAEGGTASFVIKVTNNSQTAVTNLTVTDHIDPSLEPTRASNGSQWDGADLTWKIDRLPAGKSIQLGIECRCTEAGENICNRVTVTSDQGDRETAESCLDVTAASAGLEPSIDEVGDPVAVGKQTTYRVNVTNKGASAEQNVVVIVTVPDQMTPLSAGPQGGTASKPAGKTIRFTPVTTLAPGKTLSYAVVVRADAVGNGTARVEVTSKSQTTPVAAETTTTVVK
ncbi:MAG TPA: DUF11 domain-containing protein [Pirellulales bacterium]|jgi:uncharacterized repeat protein (TIGR01451 family)|nr:DUF11 domain-containing protein [Pirellulales bacterium]